MATVQQNYDIAEQLIECVSQVLEARKHTPTATYRLQFGPELSFRSATEIVDYLQSLGVSHLYCSPYLQARPGSSHGYDVIDHQQLEPGIGTDDEYVTFVQRIREMGLRQIIDFVPNHMGIATDANTWWNSVLEHGQSSPYSAYFDIDWYPAKEELKNKILLPTLGEQFGAALENGVLSIVFEEGAFFLRCYESLLPVDPKTTVPLLTNHLEELREALEAESPALLELESIVTALEHMPNRRTADPGRIEERQRETLVVKRRLGEIVKNHPEIEEHITRNLEEMNGTPGDAASVDQLDAFVNEQVYRLAHWKVAGDEINYRRFFDVNELAAICMEEGAVFDEAHRFVMKMLACGAADGLRIDHIDGLYDPREYLWRLQFSYVQKIAKLLYDKRFNAENETSMLDSVLDPSLEKYATKLEEQHSDTPEWEQIRESLAASLRDAVTSKACHFEEASKSWNAAMVRPDQLPLYVLVEKILGSEEKLAPTWPVAGTTGYEVLNTINGIFVDRSGYDHLASFYRQLTETTQSPEDIVYECKRLILRVAMASELQMLARQLDRLSEQHRRTRDFTLNSLRAVLREFMACCSVYRTYVANGEVSDADRKIVGMALRAVRRRNPTFERSILGYVAQVLTLQLPDGVSDSARYEVEHFVQRLQQLMGPVTAKGVEDTAFYRYVPLVSLNEVGAHFGHIADLAQFHESNLARGRSNMVTTTTHDTKRTEDVRARLNVLSEIPQVWQEHLQRWMEMNSEHRQDLEDGPAPSRNDEYLFYQSSLGIWPLTPPNDEERQELIARLQQYMIKAIHEAKLRTSWIDPDEEYDNAVSAFVQNTLQADSPFLEDLQALADRIRVPGLVNALSQVLLKLTVPGVPDVYQGQEIWDFSLVDPDNRRPVDYTLRRKLLEELRSGLEHQSAYELAGELSSQPHDPKLKMYVVWRTLQFRSQHAELFHNGRYSPLQTHGQRADHVCAFAYEGSQEQSGPAAVVIAPLRSAGLTADSELPLGEPVWQDTTVSLPAGAATWVNLFTGEEHHPTDNTLSLKDVLKQFPVALLSRS